MIEERLRINDNVKTAMMLAVVFYHSCMFFTGTWFDRVHPRYEADYLAFLARYLNTFHVQTFVTASGFLFYALRRDKNKYRNHLKRDVLKRERRLLFPYICTIVFWVLPFYIIYNGVDISKIIYRYVLGCSPSQLWFLPMLFWIFIAYYVLFEKHRPNQVGLIVNVLISIGGLYVLSKLGFINIFQLVAAVHYGMFYYLGAYLYEHGVNPTIKGTVFYTSLSVGGYFLSQTLADKQAIMLKIVVLLADNIGSLASVLAVYEVVNILSNKTGNSMLWGVLKKNSFGIYLFHQQLIYPCIMLLNGRVHPIVQVLISFLVAICGASIITELFQKIKVAKLMFAL